MSVCDRDADYKTSRLHDTVVSHPRFEDHRFHSNEGVISNIRGPVYLRLMGKRYPRADVHGIFFFARVDEVFLYWMSVMFSFKRVNNHPILHIGFITDMEGLSFVAAY